MLVTTQWPLKRATYLTSLARVCVVCRSESLICAMHNFALPGYFLPLSFLLTFFYLGRAWYKEQSWQFWECHEWMNIYFTEVFRLVHHFTCIYTSSWISHTSDSHKSFNIDIYISFVLPAVRASFIQGLYFWFRVFKVIIPVYQYITKFFLRFSTLATGTLRSWSTRHQFDSCASRWCPTDANPSVPMVRAISTFSFVLKEEMKTSVGIPEEVALSSWSPYICYDFYFSYWFC